MGRLRNLTTGVELELPSRALIGRSDSCWIRLEHRLSSKEHARIHWDGEQWVLRDLGSTNGTYLDENRLDPGLEVSLVEGSKVTFGESTSQAYVLSSAEEPTALVRSLDGSAVLFAQSGLLVLPDEEHAELTLFQSANHTWLAENEAGEIRPVETGQVIETASGSWRLELPAPNDRTPTAENLVTLATAELRLRVSQDQEEVEVGLRTESQVLSLGPRWYGYFLLLLAQARREEADLPAPDRGWRRMADLTRMLKLDSNALNVATHRARRELAELGLRDAAQIIEIRRGSRRLGTDRVRIEQL